MSELSKYWTDKNIYEVNDMLEHLYKDVRISFVGTFCKPIERTRFSREIGWFHRYTIQLDGWTIMCENENSCIFFDKEMLLKWNGKYVQMEKGLTFSLDE